MTRVAPFGLALRGSLWEGRSHGDVCIPSSPSGSWVKEDKVTASAALGFGPAHGCHWAWGEQCEQTVLCPQNADMVVGKGPRASACLPLADSPPRS